MKHSRKHFTETSFPRCDQGTESNLVECISKEKLGNTVSWLEIEKDVSGVSFLLRVAARAAARAAA